MMNDDNKRYAVIAVTENGTNLALKLQKLWGEKISIYVKQGRYTKEAKQLAINFNEFDKMRDLIEEIFYRYDALIFFTSTGIAVRMIAPYLVHKAKDPAVIVLDEQAHFGISLLSGHLGGANELTKKIAQILKAQAVITTATDSNNITAPDIVANKLDLMVYPHSHIKIVNSALVQGKKVNYYVESNWNKADYYVEKLADLGFKAEKITARKLNRAYTPCVFISPKRLMMTNILILSPRRLILGVGCRKDTPCELIDKAIKKALNLIEEKYRNLKISVLVSTVVKKDEVGLLQWADEHKVKMRFFENEIMSKSILKFHLVESDFVKKQIGIGNVCEAGILSYNEKAKIILPKTKFEKATVSIGWE